MRALPVASSSLFGAVRRPPAVIWGPAAVVTAGMILPLGYLLVRTAEAGPDLLPLLFRARTFELIVRSLGLALAVTLAAVAIAVPLAWITARTDLPGRRVLGVIAALPLVIPTYVGAFTLISALGPRGLLAQYVAGPLGIDRLPSIYGFSGAWLALTLFTYPYVLLTCRAALQGMDPALEEAARGLGQSGRDVFRRVTLPQLRPAVAAGGLLVALYTLSDFGVVSLMQYDTFTSAIYVQYRGSFDRTLAAGLALILVVITAAIIFIEARVRGGRARYHRSTVGAVRPSRPQRLGSWTIPAMLFVAAAIAAGVALPLGVLGYWLARGLLFESVLRPVWLPAWNSLLASGLAAAVAVAAALPIAVLSIRFPGRVSTLIERAAYTGYALPGIVIALAMVFFATRLVNPLYQTLALVVFAYVVRFLPQAIGSARSSLLQANPRLEDAARGLGRTPSNVLRTITVPLVRPGLLAGAALVFLTAMKELPATLILAPIGFRTLATAVWSGTSEGLFAEAALAAIVLMAVSAVPLFFLARDGSRGEILGEL